jgi:hypothetical protein
MRRNVEAAGFGRDQEVFVVLRGSQRFGCVELDEVIFEHAFNIWLGPDILRIRTASATSCGHHDKSCRETDTRLVFAMCVVRRQG